MDFLWNRRMLLISFAATLVAVGLIAAPFRTAGTTQSSQDAAVGARLMRGAVDLHYHVDPGYGRYENLAQAKAAGVRTLLLKNHFEPTAAMVMLLRPQFPGLELYAGFVFNRSGEGDWIADGNPVRPELIEKRHLNTTLAQVEQHVKL